MLDSLQSGHCAQLLKVLAEPRRLRIIECLSGGRKNVSQLADLLGTEVAIVSHHLQVLLRAGLVRVEREGRWGLYSLHPKVAQSGGRCLHLGCCRLRWDAFQ
jgi:ArsR family transcriptional regulator